MAGPTASPETDKPTEPGGALASTEVPTTTTTGTELKNRKIFFFPVDICLGAQDAKNSNRLSVPSFFFVAEEIAGGGVVRESC